uniref:Uncharacterized protein n=1 Tax=Kwoniella bestiolae CBS 10118 TaxID=1296100 RepID=A0A1B9G2A4_9TREE|nr:hypothetical protein I302_04967 [Kwoniella bestiolae CBS 10118]OCF25157.1 hypothetical protein I302_04967 [Kwoniella bestiolae CBS 10118]
MDFSSSNANVSRETWAPRSPSPPARAPYPSGGEYSDRAPPSGPRGGDDPREGSNGGNREDYDRDGRKEGNGIALCEANINVQRKLLWTELVDMIKMEENA